MSAFTKEKLIQDLVDFYNIVGDFPVCAMNGPGTYWRNAIPEIKLACHVTYYKYFGSYREAMKLACEQMGIEYKRRKPGPQKGSTNSNRIDDEILIDSFVNCYKLKGELPTIYDRNRFHPRFDDVKLYSFDTYKRHFGSITKLKEIVKERLNVAN